MFAVNTVQPRCQDRPGGKIVSGELRKTKLTPPDVAKQWGVSPEKVIGWIRSGELRAFNAATRHSSGRPRYLIDSADLLAFEQRRRMQPTTRTPRRRCRPMAGVPEYF